MSRGKMDLISQLRTFMSEQNNNLQFVKEVDTAEAIYSLYLKKYTYNASRQNLTEELGVATINFKTKELRVIKAGTIDRLIDSLFIESGEIDGTYVRIFLATYRTFTSPQIIAEKLTELYRKYETSELKKATICQKSIFSVLSIWLDLYITDFDEPPSYNCLQILRKFLKSAAPGSDLFNRVCHKFTKFCAEDEPDDGVSLDSCDSDSGDVRRKSYSHEELVEVVEFSQLNVRTVAEQLTRIDAELFVKLEAHQCLGSTWNQRGREKVNECPTVASTVEMFNSVIYQVISTILKDLDLKASKRAKIIEKWICIAQELRMMKNFSSLRAIISGLQSSPIYRLRKLWQHVSRDALEVFLELSEIFSLDSNQITSRELLMKEGTAKVCNQTIGRKRSKDKTNAYNPYFSKYDQGALCCGTVPYLGTFLSDLTMIDSAHSDYTDSGLINFEKRRKEFEILAQISLFQSAAKMYNIEPHRRFNMWFDSMRVYTEDESYSLSCELEPPTTPEKVSSHKAKFSAMSYSKSLALSLGSLSMALSSPASPDGVSLDSTTSVDSARPVTSQSSISSSDSDPQLPDRRVIRASLQLPGCSECMYKSMMLSNKDRSPAVIRRVLDKFHLEESDQSQYSLVQLTDRGKELSFPRDANIYYAMDTTNSQYTFIVRRRDGKHAQKKMPKARSFS